MGATNLKKGGGGVTWSGVERTRAGVMDGWRVNERAWACKPLQRESRVCGLHSIFFLVGQSNGDSTGCCRGSSSLLETRANTSNWNPVPVAMQRHGGNHRGLLVPHGCARPSQRMWLTALGPAVAGQPTLLERAGLTLASFCGGVWANAAIR